MTKKPVAVVENKGKTEGQEMRKVDINEITGNAETGTRRLEGRRRTRCKEERSKGWEADKDQTCKA
ncbi:unnamed protein product [Dovyalis caffra]|uniref:Uncharacterized protein n=1 Tax=Dovyalis caffra TaxID=77055 RepID=A0AAV1R3M7_9ROSI|nr:unnamed protein product [Dovyalis caffra]